MGLFVKDLWPKVVKLPLNIDIKIWRAHCSLQTQAADPAATPRRIIARFLDAAVEVAILQQAWSQRKVMLQDRGYVSIKIFFPSYRRSELRLISHQAVETNKHAGQMPLSNTTEAQDGLG